jgi:CDP-archaeol synthase
MNLGTWLPEFHALVLLVAANAVPVIAQGLARERWSYPLDAGCTLADGQRLFGGHKTWRGLIAGIAATALAAWVVGLPLWLGAGFATVSLLADAATSMAKRRLRLPPGTELPGLDQLAEIALPLLLFARPLKIDLAGMLFVSATFLVLDVLTAPLRRSR